MDLDRSISSASRGTIVALIVTLVGVSCAALVAKDEGPVEATADPVRLPICAVEERRTVTASASCAAGGPSIETAAIAADAQPSDPRRR